MLHFFRSFLINVQFNKCHCERPKGARQSSFAWIASSLVLLAMTVVIVTPAQAEYFYWAEPEVKVSLTYPDTWHRIHGQQPDDVLSLAAPGKNEFAVCRLRVKQDRRFMVYPQRYSDEIQRQNFSYHFWDAYVGEFDEANLHEVHDNAGLGLGFGSWAEASYITSAGPKVFKRSLMFVSLYRDKAYVLDCSAEASVFKKWRNSFLSLARSVDFREVVHQFPYGYYRNFLKDAAVEIRNERPIDTVYY